MKTLYDLLGALPDDDAESLRTAFRQAAKATHPDINTHDPDAPLKFRQIVRANAILSDADQRATYDRLLSLTLRRPNWKLKRTIRKVASDAIKVACLSAVSIGGYLVFEQSRRHPSSAYSGISVPSRRAVIGRFYPERWMPSRPARKPGILRSTRRKDKQP